MSDSLSTKQTWGTVSALFAGVVFGIGLLLGGMVDATKVLAFLDVAGAWDPSLALVMGGAVLVGALAFRIAKGRSETFVGLPLELPTKTAIDRRLVVGSVMFGLGWGLSGLCPGPAIVAVAAGHFDVIAFVLAMLVGLAIGNAIEARTSKPAPLPEEVAPAE